MSWRIRFARKKNQEATLKSNPRSRWQRSTGWGGDLDVSRRLGKLPKQVSLSWILQADGRARVKPSSDWRKSLKNVLEDEETAHAHGLEEPIIGNDPSTKSSLQIWCNPNTNSKVTLWGPWKNHPKIYAVWLLCLFVYRVRFSVWEDTFDAVVLFSLP